jgi:hypothetical protein
MLRRLVIVPTVLLAVVALSACSTPPTVSPSASATATPTATAPPAATGLYTCADIAGPADVAPAFATVDGAVPTPIAATRPAVDLLEYAVPAVGGLACSWRVGTAAGSPLEYPADADWAYLSVKILPGAADSWAPSALGDGPADTPVAIDGVQAAMGCGDPGCFISAPVGDAWVELDLSSIYFGYGSGRGHFDGLSTDAILAQMRPVAASVFSTLADAEPGRLAWPRVDPVEREPACTGALQSQGVAMALGVDSLEYEIFDSTMTGPIYFDGYVAQTAGMFTCYVHADGILGTSITVGNGLGGIVDTLVSAPDTQAGLPPIVLEGAVDGEHAVQICAESSAYCTVIFSLGESAYQVESRTDAVAVAEAIIAQAR